MNAMAEESAAIAYFLCELAGARIRIAENVEEERVSAPLADILVVGTAPRNSDVVMSAEEARQGMGNMRDPVALIKNRAATANTRRTSISGDARVVDSMPKEQTSR